ncbi:hypothetical protein BHE74_00004857 [Ensete ventricosum]|nr:hypothetical protein BHE74_00004857 [Ensete ventricosum]
MEEAERLKTLTDWSKSYLDGERGERIKIWGESHKNPGEVAKISPSYIKPLRSRDWTRPTRKNKGLWGPIGQSDRSVRSHSEAVSPWNDSGAHDWTLYVKAGGARGGRGTGSLVCRVNAPEEENTIRPLRHLLPAGLTCSTHDSLGDDWTIRVGPRWKDDEGTRPTSKLRTLGVDDSVGGQAADWNSMPRRKGGAREGDGDRTPGIEIGRSGLFDAKRSLAASHPRPPSCVNGNRRVKEIVSDLCFSLVPPPSTSIVTSIASPSILSCLQGVLGEVEDVVAKVKDAVRAKATHSNGWVRWGQGFGGVVEQVLEGEEAITMEEDEDVLRSCLWSYRRDML